MAADESMTYSNQKSASGGSPTNHIASETRTYLYLYRQSHGARRTANQAEHRRQTAIRARVRGAVAARRQAYTRERYDADVPAPSAATACIFVYMAASDR